MPGLAMVRLRRVSLERRHGNLDEAEALLRDAMQNGTNTGETSFYAVKLARQLMKVQRSLGKAKKVLLEAIEKDQVRVITEKFLVDVVRRDDMREISESIETS